MGPILRYRRTSTSLKWIIRTSLGKLDENILFFVHVVFLHTVHAVYKFIHIKVVLFLVRFFAPIRVCEKIKITFKKRGKHRKIYLTLLNFIFFTILNGDNKIYIICYLLNFLYFNL